MGRVHGGTNLDASRRNQPVPRLAAWSLGAGIVATVGANLAHGFGHGPIGARVSAWPALALVGSFELLMMLIRTRRGTQPSLAEDAQRYPDAPPLVQEVPSELTFTSTLEQIIRARHEAGQSQRAIARELNIDRRRSSASSTKRPDEWLTPAGRDGRTHNDARMAGDPLYRWWGRCWMTSWLLTCVITLVRTSLSDPPRKVTARQRAGSLLVVRFLIGRTAERGQDNICGHIRCWPLTHCAACPFSHFKDDGGVGKPACPGRTRSPGWLIITLIVAWLTENVGR